MRKYSKFGIALSKEFLAAQGASPVIYVPKSGRPSLLPYEGYAAGRVESQAIAFNHFWKLFKAAERASLEQGIEKPGPLGKDLRRLLEFIEIHVVANLKFFDHRLGEESKKNYYMEREWRAGRDVHFKLADVQRIVVPRMYAKEIRRDFPYFRGEVIFADKQH